MKSRSRVAVMLGDEAARIGLVAAHRIAQLAEGLVGDFRYDWHAACAVAVTDNDIGARPVVLRADVRRHGVEIDQYRGAEVAMDARQQAPQRAVIRLVQTLDAAQ